MAEPTDPDELEQLVAGRSDDEIDAAVSKRGVDETLASVFAALAHRYRPERAEKSLEAAVRWDIAAPGGTRSWRLRLTPDGCHAGPAEGGDARVVLAMGLADFLRFLAGHLEIRDAFLDGRLRVSGDLVFAQKLGALFGD